MPLIRLPWMPHIPRGHTDFFGKFHLRMSWRKNKLEVPFFQQLFNYCIYWKQKQETFSKKNGKAHLDMFPWFGGNPWFPWSSNMIIGGTSGGLHLHSWISWNIMISIFGPLARAWHSKGRPYVPWRRMQEPTWQFQRFPKNSLQLSCCKFSQIISSVSAKLRIRPPMSWIVLLVPKTSKGSEAIWGISSRNVFVSVQMVHVNTIQNKRPCSSGRRP